MQGAFGGGGLGANFGAASVTGGLTSGIMGSPDRKSGLSMLNPSLKKMN